MHPLRNSGLPLYYTYSTDDSYLKLLVYVSISYQFMLQYLIKILIHTRMTQRQ